MKVVVNCLPIASGGGVSYLSNMVPFLSRHFEGSAGRHILTLLAAESQRSVLASVPESQCKWLGGPRRGGIAGVFAQYWNIPRIANRLKADVIFTPSMIGPRVPGVKQVLMLHNMEPFHFREYRYGLKSQLRNNVLYWKSSCTLRKAERVIAVSRFVEQLLTRRLRISPSRVRLIYHGQDTAFTPDGNLEKDQDRLRAIGVVGEFLLTCGSLLPYRRCEDVIAAFNQCAGSIGVGINLVIAGAGSDARYAATIRNAISHSPYRNRIVATGHVSKETMSALYRRCRTCIIASEIEACPMIAIEAMSSGCALISSDRPPLPEVFQGASLEYRSRDVEGLAGMIQTCLRNDALRLAIKARALQRAEEFSWEKCANETYAALIEW